MRRRRVFQGRTRTRLAYSRKICARGDSIHHQIDTNARTRVVSQKLLPSTMRSRTPRRLPLEDCAIATIYRRRREAAVFDDVRSRSCAQPRDVNDAQRQRYQRHSTERVRAPKKTHRAREGAAREREKEDRDASLARRRAPHFHDVANDAEHTNFVSSGARGVQRAHVGTNIL